MENWRGAGGGGTTTRTWEAEIVKTMRDRKRTKAETKAWSRPPVPQFLQRDSIALAALP